MTAQQRQQLSCYLFDRIDSTNEILAQLIEQGTQPPMVAIATEQTAGRGQWGRKWQSLPGGLYLSMALRVEIAAQDAPHLTLFTAAGIAETLRRYHIPVGLKWPNDLILKGRKLGGIKSETRINQGLITSAVIGVGINWTNPVPEVGINLQSYLQEQPTASINSLEELAALTIGGILAGYERYIQKGIEIILDDYLKCLQSLGKKVMVNGSLGTVVGVSSQGELQVRLYSPGAMTQLSLPPGTITLGYD
ncbi:biotin--[acetyl-CoA-carboxylase] ligase [Gloeothece verrucosa]|uniref:Biotin/acetyl-CoA-carboxylase ligase n=1 Tax=Gloeothece verrucosa (strain PCC 7822) TaxID=497965 RepID=E0UIT1_GLOV7|nr:biotin--[acetyl-CoA-carboxylase] ligase [Gloeothece verrucosa]ADN13390.1 biotin/acetyl-CoA-carboxylase ligase [Gloeothece verrucosa PCC 7822]